MNGLKKLYDEYKNASDNYSKNEQAMNEAYKIKEKLEKQYEQEKKEQDNELHRLYKEKLCTNPVILEFINKQKELHKQNLEMDIKKLQDPSGSNTSNNKHHIDYFASEVCFFCGLGSIGKEWFTHESKESIENPFSIVLKTFNENFESEYGGLPRNHVSPFYNTNW